MRTINLIVLHCTATRVTQDFTVEDLKACHLARGFKTIGYHYYITKDGTLYPCRPEREVGAHARHYNAHSIAVCYEGGLDANGKPADTRTLAQKVTMEELLKSLCPTTPMPPSSVIVTSPAFARSAHASTPRNGSKTSTSTSKKSPLAKNCQRGF